MKNILTNSDIKKYTYSIYILQALGFVFIVTPILAVIINYVKDDDVKGSWLESHFRWQKNTFWYGIVWLTLGFFYTVNFDRICRVIFCHCLDCLSNRKRLDLFIRW